MIRVADVAGGMRSAIAHASRSAISRRAAPIWAAAVVVVIALVTAVALGALERSEIAAPMLAAGDEVRMPLYAITVSDIELTDEIEEESLSADEGETLVVVTARMENLSDRPIGVGRSADKVESQLLGISSPLLELVGVPPGGSPPQVWRDDGSAGAVFLQPGVPSEVTLAWTVPDDAFADGVVELDVYDAVESRGKVILSADYITWRRGDLAARIAVDTGSGR